MAHVYATVGDANNGLISAGATVLATETAAIVADKLSMLDAVSRRIDNACHRSAFGSGFGPRIGTNYYDGDNWNELLLRDDLQSLSAFTIAPATGGTGISPTVTTDYFLANADGYTGPPWRKVILHRHGTPVVFASGYRTIVATGTWGYSNVTLPTGTTVASGLAADAAATTFTTSASPTLSPGMTLLIGSEQLYLYGLSTTTATVVRGVNGTTPAVHADASTIARYSYDARVVECAKALFVRRWKSRDAGADGSDGGGQMPGITPREGEETIIRRRLADLALLGQY